MSIVSLAEYRAMLREVPDAALDTVLQTHLDAAEAEASQFVGFDIAAEYETDVPPPDLKAAVAFLAQTMSDQMPPDEVHVRKSRAESLMRPHRRETGIAEAAA